MKIPYGVADFETLRGDGLLYIDRTDRIPVFEGLGRALLLLRPRRFGKSLWLSTLANYYDLRNHERHSVLFKGLAAADRPPESRYFILRWDFSKIDPEPPPWGINAQVSSRKERIGNDLRGYLNTTLEVFLRDYRAFLPEVPELHEDPFHNLERLLSVIRQTPHRLYLLVDEYDNFANEVLVNDQEAYQDLVLSDGPFRYLFKWVKSLMAGSGLDRLFITGVSPLVMSDVTSGMNIAEDVYLAPELNTLCGFTGEEVEGLLESLHQQSSDSEEGESSSWAPEEALGMMRDWYNGYRFTSLTTAEAVYNPTLVLYFLSRLQRYGDYPRQMLDANLAADEGKLDYLARVTAGQDAVIDLVRSDEPLEVPQIRDRFTLREMLERSSQDSSFLGSYLYYFGMLTLAGETSRRTWLLEAPNEVIRGLYVERIKRLLIPDGVDRSAAMKPARSI